ncbi:MAG: hypothetical protein IJH00_00775 [Erysipelotrichaceae bacterium]|nr:hypothetical protein [Erysipelotrichaceae bacterium]MBQ6494123.1 hypothetical protein [Erysipelotrichaceae bacterium]
MKKFFISSILMIIIAISLVGCSSGGTSTKKPSGLYRDSDNILMSHPDNNMLWKTNVVVIGDEYEYEFKLKNDKLELTDREDGTSYACKIEFFDGIKGYDIDDYDADKDEYCPVGGTYFKYDSSGKPSGQNISETDSQDTNESETNSSLSEKKTVYEIPVEALKYRKGTVAEIAGLDIDKYGVTEMFYPLESYFTISIPNYAANYFGDEVFYDNYYYYNLVDQLKNDVVNNCNSEGIFVYGVYTDLLGDIDADVIKLPEEIDGLPVIAEKLDLTVNDCGGAAYEQVGKNVILFLSENGLSNLNQIFAGNTLIIDGSRNPEFLNDYELLYLKATFEDTLNSKSVPDAKYACLEIRDDAAKSDVTLNFDNTKVLLIDSVIPGQVNSHDLYKVNLHAENVDYLNIEGTWNSVYIEETNLALFDQFITINKVLTLKGENHLEDLANIEMRSGSKIINKTGQEIDWKRLIQNCYNEQATFETGRIDCGSYPVEVVSE